MTRKQYQNATGIFSTNLAVGSFLIGTLVLILHLLLPGGNMLLFGLVYVALASLCNLMMLLYLAFLLLTQKNHVEYYTIKILILMANIPIAFIYAKIVSESCLPIR